MNDYQVIGKSVPLRDGVIKVSGKASYTSDLSRPNMLIGKILFSDRPHARIISIDTQKAKDLPGVKAIITAKDFADSRYGAYLFDRHALASDKVRYIGEPVAAVAAIDEGTCIAAINLIRIEYEDLPSSFTIKGSLIETAPQIHPEIDSYVGVYPYINYGNVCMDAKLTKGNLKKGFCESELIIEKTYHCKPMHQLSLEPHACLAEFDFRNKLTIWTGTQQLSVCHNEIAKALGIPHNHFKVVPAILGGGFGGKLKSHIEPITAKLTLESKRPVKITLTREEEFFSTHPRAPFEIHIKMGVNQDGIIKASEVEILADAGGYSDHVIGTATHALTCVEGAYNIQNIESRARVVYTNNPDWGCMRGYGGLQMTYALESHLDLVAKELGISPIEMRERNLCKDGEQMITTQTRHGIHISQTMKKALDEAGYWNKKGKLSNNRGIGIANIIHMTGLLSSSAFIKMNEDTTVDIITGIIDIGTGTQTALCQIAAEVLGISMSKVNIASQDSETAPYDLGSIDSRTIFDAGNAVRRAAEDLRNQLCRVASDVLNVDAKDLYLNDEKVIHKNNPETFLSFYDCVGISLYVMHGPLIGNGFLISENPFPEAVGEGYGQGPGATFLCGSHVAEVEVDPDTGSVKILNYVAVHDVGIAINPAGVIGQIEGGVVQGIGYALYEELIVNDGKILNTSLTDYHIPTVMEIPHIKAIYLENPERQGPFGAKGLGEPPIMGVLPAITNAIFDACGVHMDHVPITPESLFYALRAKNTDD